MAVRSTRPPSPSSPTYFDGTLSGTLYAGDGTPLSYANYSIVRADGSKVPCSSYYYYWSGWTYYYVCSTDYNGSFTSSAFSTRNAEPLTVEVSRSDFDPVTYAFTYPAGATTATIAPKLPIFVVHGTVVRSDGTPVPSGSVTMLVADPADPEVTYTYGNYIQADGSFTVYGTRLGSFTLTAQTTLGVSGSAAGAVTDFAVAVTGVNVMLEPAGSVTGMVTRGGTALPDVEVILTIPDRGLSQSYQTNSSGAFEAFDVPFGAYTITARTDYGEDYIYAGSEAGALSVENPSSIVSLVFTTNPGSIYGTVFDKNGVPAMGTDVDLIRVSDNYRFNLYTDSMGYYEMPNLEPGAYLAEAYGWNDSEEEDLVAAADGALGEGGTLQLDLTLKPATYLRYTEFDRPDSWYHFVINYGGTIRYGWDSNDLYDSPFWYFYDLWDNVAGDEYYASYASVDAFGQFEVAPEVIGGKIYSRKLYTPPDGGFLRYLEIVKNPGTTQLGFTPNVYGYLEYPNYGTWAYTVGAAETGNTYVVEKAASDTSMPQVAMVLQGVSTAENPVAAPVVTTSANVTDPRWGWPLTIPAGGKACILHYFLVALPAATDLEARAKALRDLTDPYALTGLTEEDKACIKNFILPQE